jgi:hypothetical protein
MDNPITAVTNSKRRIIATVFIVGLVIGTAGVATALTQTSLNTQQLSLFDSQTADSDFSITSYDTTITGEDSVTVDLTLNNTDSAAHEADVTVQLVDSTGTVLVEETQVTGSVAGGASTSTTYTFSQTGLAANYEETFIVVDQTS